MEYNSSTDEMVGKLQQKKDDTVKRILNGIKSYAYLIIALLLAIFWVFYGAVKIEDANLSAKNTFILGFSKVIMGMSLTSVIATQGFRKGKLMPIYIDAKKEWETAEKQALGKQKEITNYATNIAKENIKLIRKDNLENALIKYDEIFDENGKVKPDLILKKRYKVDGKKIKNKYSRKQLKTIKKCIALKVNLPNIFGGFSSKFFGVKKEITKQEYETKNQTISLVGRIIFAFLSASIVFAYNGLTANAVIDALVQVFIWGIGGYLQNIKNFEFIVGTEVEQIKNKTMIIKSYLEKESKENGTTNE